MTKLLRVAFFIYMYNKKLKLTKKEMLEDLLLTHIRKVRMNLLMSVRDLDDFEDEVVRRFKNGKRDINPET